ncbi:hypothetical protein [Streptomyces sp. bgisy084]|uniref:hypothetical protein n=1 Tax=unclassified Streptomyces TaxID=2593676 RepID=UPI003D72B98C
MFGIVDAEGEDDLAVQLLGRAGFLRSMWNDRTVHHLPLNIGEQRENAMASAAAQMLTVARYTVDLDPALRGPEAANEADAQDSHSAQLQIRDLTDRMLGADSYVRAEYHADQVLHPDFGVMARLSEFFKAAAEQAQASGSDEGSELHHRFTEAATTLTALGEELADAPERLRELGPPKPHRRDRASHYNATTPKRPITATPTAGCTRSIPPASPALPPRHHR